MVIVFSVLLRVMVGFGSYSGYNDPPKFGDYEAQRHWMELTNNLESKDWYSEVYGNNLTYWRLDYPPLSAYHSYLCGYLSNIFYPGSIDLIDSKGYETSQHKSFMRKTALVSCFVFYMSALIYYIMYSSKKMEYSHRLSILLLALCSPLLILIDHGHFQYNCVMSGLVLWALICTNKN